MGGTMPVWGAVVLAISVALITQIGTYMLHTQQRRHDRDRHLNEEWHRNLRWAVDLITDGTEDSLVLGVHALDALDDDASLSAEDQRLIDAILTAILNGSDEYDEDNGGNRRYTEPHKDDGGDSE